MIQFSYLTSDKQNYSDLSEPWFKQNYSDLSFSLYPDNAPMVETNKNPRSILLRAPYSYIELYTMLHWVDAVNARGMGAPDLTLPYIIGSRADRLNKEGDQLFTLKSVVKDITAREFNSITILDPHSDVTSSLFDRVNVATVLDVFKFGNINKQWDAVIAPDAGATKRARLIAEHFNIPFVQAWKKRNIETGTISGFGCEPFNFDRVLVVDDICDGGNTFIGLVDAINKTTQCNYETIDLYVTHGFFTQGINRLKEKFNEILVTDSCYNYRAGTHLYVINICEAIFNGVYHV